MLLQLTHDTTGELATWRTGSSLPQGILQSHTGDPVSSEVRVSPLAQSWENVGFSNTSVGNKFVLPTFRPGILDFFKAKDGTDASTCHYIALHLNKCYHRNFQLAPQVFGQFCFRCSSMQPSSIMVSLALSVFLQGAAFWLAHIVKKWLHFVIQSSVHINLHKNNV